MNYSPKRLSITQDEKCKCDSATGKWSMKEKKKRSRTTRDNFMVRTPRVNVLVGTQAT